MKSEKTESRSLKFKNSEPRKLVAELIAIPKEERNELWLRYALRTALKLEFTTICPYLCAWWSIKDKSSEAAKSIRTHIAEEEMLHLGLVCNLLVAIGLSPDLTSQYARPTYPGPLPGGIELPEGEEVTLQGFSRSALQTFIHIETPQNPITIGDTRSNRSIPRMVQQSAQNIGEFYEMIKEAFTTLDPPPTINTERQLALEFGSSSTSKDLFVIESIEGEDKSVVAAIDLIIKQGEGSPTSPEDTGIDDLAHYYRFLEIYEGRKIEEDGAGGFRYSGTDLIPFPEGEEVRPMAAVPAGGYQLDNSTEIGERMQRFDTQYTEMLLQIEAAWNPEVWESGGDGKSYLNAAIETMFALTEDAQFLMEQRIPGNLNDETYGPCFRVDDSVIEAPPLSAEDDEVQNPTWEEHIKYFFTEYDILGMRGRINLDSYEDVTCIDPDTGKDNARKILERVQLDPSLSTAMPPPHTHRHWSDGRIKTFEKWIELGTPKGPSPALDSVNKNHPTSPPLGSANRNYLTIFFMLLFFAIAALLSIKVMSSFF